VGEFKDGEVLIWKRLTISASRKVVIQFSISILGIFMSNQHLLQQCKSLVPLSTLREHHLLALLEDAEELMVFKGDTLFTENEHNDALIYLLSGEVLLKNANGNERIITADFHWLPIVQFQSEEFSSTALMDCQLLKLNRETLDNLLTWSQVADYLEIDISYDRNFDEDADWLRTILNSNLFYKIPPLNVLSIYDKVSAITVGKNDVIIKQGQEGDYCYFIKEGKAKVTRVEEDGETLDLAEIGIGRCFGEDALIKQSPRNASIKMLSEGVLMRLHKNDFMSLLEEPCDDHVDFKSMEQIEDSDSPVEFLDVRTQEEYDYKHIDNALHIPLTLLRLKIRLLNPEKHYVVYCNTGVRSRATAYLLAQKGFNITVLEGGLSSISQRQVETLLVSEYDSIHQLAHSQ
jgi:CRP-like cAMP-binding protein